MTNERKNVIIYNANWKGGKERVGHANVELPGDVDGVEDNAMWTLIHKTKGDG